MYNFLAKHLICKYRYFDTDTNGMDFDLVRVIGAGEKKFK